MSGTEQKNEGEGSRTAAREYNERTENFVHTTDVDKLAKEAANDLDSDKGNELRRAEAEARKALDGKNVKVTREP